MTRSRTAILPVLVLIVSLPASASDDAPVSADVQRGKEAFEANCGACHGLELPRSQRLDRATWKAVIDDMVNDFGANWITDDQQALILEYLVEHHGPPRP